MKNALKNLVRIMLMPVTYSQMTTIVQSTFAVSAEKATY